MLYGMTDNSRRGSRGWIGLALRCCGIGLLACVCVAGTAAEASAEQKELSLERAIDVAMSNNDQVRDAEVTIRQREASHRASTAKFGPSFRLESSVQRWDEPQTTEFSAPGQSGGAELTVREQTTSNLSMTVVQPLTPLWSIYEAQRIEQLNLRQAEAAQTQTRRDVTLDVVEAYFRLLQARAVHKVAKQSLDRRKRQLRRARSFHQAEQVPKNDVLRAKVGVAQAKQEVIQARGRIDLAGAQLARVMGTSMDRSISPTSQVEIDYSPPADVGAAVRTAIERRTEFEEAELRIEQASAGVRAARSQLLPQVNALASYQRSYGSTFSNEESFFVGVNLQWTFWQWGTKSFEVDSALAQKQRAEIGRSRLERGIELEVRNAYTNFETSRESLKVARQAVDAARENYRAEEKRYEAQLSTSIDLLDAETQLTETRTNAQNAEYEHFIAAAKLRRALGLSPWETAANDAVTSEAK